MDRVPMSGQGSRISPWSRVQKTRRQKHLSKVIDLRQPVNCPRLPTNVLFGGEDASGSFW
jgi:hypothetical protein